MLPLRSSHDSTFLIPDFDAPDWSVCCAPRADPPQAPRKRWPFSTRPRCTFRISRPRFVRCLYPLAARSPTLRPRGTTLPYPVRSFASLWLPLPLAPRKSSCRGQLDSGITAPRVPPLGLGFCLRAPLPLEHAVARVCREAGGLALRHEYRCVGGHWAHWLSQPSEPLSPPSWTCRLLRASTTLCQSCARSSLSRVGAGLAAALPGCAPNAAGSPRRAV